MVKSCDRVEIKDIVRPIFTLECMKVQAAPQNLCVPYSEEVIGNL